jgi:tetratricopeptide (TPR) repeat protein
LAFIAQHVGGAVVMLQRIPLSQRLENVPVSYVRYLEHMAWFANLTVFYVQRHWQAWQVAGSVALLMTMGAIFVSDARRRPWNLVGWLWFMLSILPTIGIVQVGFQAMADRFTYFPSIGLCVAAAWTFPLDYLSAHRLRWAATASCAIVIAILIFSTNSYLRDWRDDDALLDHGARSEDSWVIHRYHGQNYGGRDMLEPALAEYRLSLKYFPDQIVVNDYIGTILMKQGKVDEAIQSFRADLRVNGDDPATHAHLAKALATRGQLDAAMAELSTALRLDPRSFDANDTLALLLAKSGRYQEAVDRYAIAIAANSDSVPSHGNRGIALMKLNRLDEAEQEFRTALKLQPDYKPAINNLARLAARRAASVAPQ